MADFALVNVMRPLPMGGGSHLFVHRYWSRSRF